jgi:hypothetical protein
MQRQEQLGIFYFKVVGTIFSSSLQKGGLFTFGAGWISLYAHWILLGRE